MFDYSIRCSFRVNGRSKTRVVGRNVCIAGSDRIRHWYYVYGSLRRSAFYDKLGFMTLSKSKAYDRVHYC